MPSCIHGNVCLAWMTVTKSIAPLSKHCPICKYFDSESDTNKMHIMADEYYTYYDKEHDQYITKRR